MEIFMYGCGQLLCLAAISEQLLIKSFFEQMFYVDNVELIYASLVVSGCAVHVIEVEFLTQNFWAIRTSRSRAHQIAGAQHTHTRTMRDETESIRTWNWNTFTMFSAVGVH